MNKDLSKTIQVMKAGITSNAKEKNKEDVTTGNTSPPSNIRQNRTWGVPLSSISQADHINSISYMSRKGNQDKLQRGKKFHCRQIALSLRGTAVLVIIK